MGLADLLKINNGLEKLVIISYEEKERKKAKKSFVVLFNPTNISWEFKANYKQDKATGTNQGRSSEYTGEAPKKVSVELLFDATNTSPFEGKYSPAEGDTILAADLIKNDEHVETAIEEMRNILQKPKGETHKPYYLKLAWAKKTLDCVLQSMSVNYKLFNPAGLAIRATVTCQFIENLARTEQKKDPENKSPNLTHVRSLDDHLTLPLLAQEIYLDPRYYIQLAGINKITNLRKRATRQKIALPPFDKKSK